LKPAQPASVVHREPQRAQRTAAIQLRAALQQQFLFAFEIGRRVLLQIFFQTIQAPLHRAEIRQD
jgi:hypothetical protein